MTKKSLFALSVLTAMVVACHNKSVPVIPARTEFPPSPRSTVKPLVENSPEAIAAGKLIFDTRCTRCHDVRVVDAYTPERWATILQTMVPRARLNEEQAKQVRSYVMANAKK
jgi:mono/diheme cytochrome c family protein